MRTIAVVNQKGGCGKTTTAINLSGFLAVARRRVLLVDMDPQGHATLGLLTDAIQPSKTMYDVFVGENGKPRTSLSDITRSVVDNLDVAPADIRLSAAPDHVAMVLGREDILARCLDEIQDQYDYAIIDCPPSVSLLTFNALNACSEAIVPMDPSFFSLHGIGKLLETLDVLAKKNRREIVARVLVTLYSGRSQFARDVVDEVHRHMSGRHFDTMIRHSVKLAEAASHGQPIANYCRKCAGFTDYRALAAEVMQQETEMPVRQSVRFQPPEAQTGALEAVDSPSAPMRIREGVVFAIDAPDAGRVQLVGDFNNWALEGSEMDQHGRVWKKVLSLGPGRYLYRYVVDGCWQSDPSNANVEPAPYGGDNSVLVLDDTLAEMESVDAA